MPRKARTAVEVEAKVELTQRMLIQRVQEIIDRHVERGFDRPTCVNYVRQLFSKFRARGRWPRRSIRAICELAPEQYADFWRESAAYIDGTAGAPRGQL